uniref:THAP domaincontaining protein 9like [Acyrthosiphon pisum] n=1 Tax=Lepeophtheirus salmonis TaxID=72036 RepID=A0A0K2U294_LEPSM|nr:THAP domain-containing protein 1-like [Lepeophtheirus salmonis]
MTHSCAAFGCKNNSKSTGRDITFHRIPNNPKIQSNWRFAIRWKKWKLNSHRRICSDHFYKEDFITNPQRRILKEGVVPFKCSTQTLSRKTPIDIQTQENIIQVDQMQEEPSSRVNIPSTSSISYLPDIKKRKTHNDHNYTYPNDIDAIKEKCNFLRDSLQNKIVKEISLKTKVKRSKSSNSNLMQLLDNHLHDNILRKETPYHLDKYKGVQLTLVKDLISKKSRTSTFSDEVMEFSQTLNFYSPKAYEFVRKTFSLPSQSTLKKQMPSVHCLPDANHNQF